MNSCPRCGKETRTTYCGKACATGDRDNSDRTEPAKRAGTSSRYLGVYYSVRRRGKPWRAYLRFGGKLVFNQYFLTEHDAAVARDGAAREYYGARARLNYPRRGERDIHD